MKFKIPIPRLSFQVKVLLPVIAVMALLVVATMWMVNQRISEQLYANANENLATTHRLFITIQKNHEAQLLERYRNVVNEPRFKAVTQKADFATLKSFLDDIIQEVVNDKEATIATFTFIKEREQRTISANSDPELSTTEFQYRASEAIRQASIGSAKVDTVRVGTKLLDIVAFPVGSGDETAGVLTYGVPIGTTEVEEIKQLTGSEIVCFTDGKISASSLPPEKFNTSVVARYNELVSAAAGGRKVNREIWAGNERYLCETGQFTSLSGDTHIGYLLLNPYGKSLADFKATQRELLGIGVIGISVATLVVCMLIQSLTRPLRQLRKSAEAVGRGDFSNPIQVESNDECAELAVAFNQMAQNIKTSRDELEKTVDTLKATQNQLVQSEKLSGIGEFVAGVAHELNNPLTSVMGFSELLQNSELPEQARHYLDVIAKSAKRCQKIVQSLLSFARRHAPERKILCVNAIVESAVEILQYQMRTSNIEVLMHLDPMLPASDVDQHQMQQVFLNIINNARQAMEGRTTPGWLRVTTESTATHVRVIFQDNGPGIPAENLKRIFNPFFTTKEVGKGTGLGLSLCYGIVSEHGGTITPLSPPGEGAMFIIELPIAKTKPVTVETTPVESKENAREGVGKRVLVVDDEDCIVQMIKEALTRSGYRVDVALDGESALRRLGQYHYDLALCDWKMPGLNGQQVFERLKDSNPEMSRRLIFITGDVVNEKTQEFLRAQNKVCLSKPFTFGEFRTAINQVVHPETETVASR